MFGDHDVTGYTKGTSYRADIIIARYLLQGKDVVERVFETMCRCKEGSVLFTIHFAGKTQTNVWESFQRGNDNRL
jgi:hypothetical protein